MCVCVCCLPFGFDCTTFVFTFSLVVSDMRVITTAGRVEHMLTDKLILQLCKSAPYGFFVFMYLVRGNPSEEYIIGSIIKLSLIHI